MRTPHYERIEFPDGLWSATSRRPHKFQGDHFLASSILTSNALVYSDPRDFYDYFAQTTFFARPTQRCRSNSSIHIRVGTHKVRDNQSHYCEIPNRLSVETGLRVLHSTGRSTDCSTQRRLTYQLDVCRQLERQSSVSNRPVSFGSVRTFNVPLGFDRRQAMFPIPGNHLFKCWKCGLSRAF